MKIFIYSSRKYEQKFLTVVNNQKHELTFADVRLSADIVHLARKYTAVSVFANDNASTPIIEELHRLGVKFILLQSVTFTLFFFLFNCK